MLENGRLTFEHNPVLNSGTFQTAVVELKTLVNRGVVSIPVTKAAEFYFDLDNYASFTTGWDCWRFK